MARSRLGLGIANLRKVVEMHVKSQGSQAKAPLSCTVKECKNFFGPTSRITKKSVVVVGTLVLHYPVVVPSVFAPSINISKAWKHWGVRLN